MMGGTYLCVTDLVYISIRDVVLTADTIMITFMHHFFGDPSTAFRLYTTCADSIVAHCIDEEAGVLVSGPLEDYAMNYSNEVFVPMLTGESDIW